jgi:YD repeat-containing protein
VEKTVDLSWALPTGHFVFQRTYLSGRAWAGQLGAGWAHRFERRIEDRGPDGVAEVDSRGPETVFLPNGVGGYSAAFGGAATLVRDLAGVWVVTYRAGTKARYRSDGKLESIGDGSTTLTMEYTTTGELRRVVDPFGGALEFELSNGLISTAISKDGERVQFAYNADRKLISATNGLNQTTAYFYDPVSGFMSTIVRPTADRLDISYQVEGRVEREVTTSTSGQQSRCTLEYPDQKTRVYRDPSGRAYTFTLDDDGNVTQRTDPSGASWTLARDAAGRPTSLTDPDGRKEQWTYAADGKIDSYVAPDGAKTSVERDALGLPITLVRPDGTRAERQFDASGNVVATKDAQGGLTQYRYNSRGQVTSVVDPGGRVTSTEYDAAGNATRKIDPLGRQTLYQYDALGRLVAETSPEGRTTRTEYCSCGKPSATIDAAGNRTEYEYDALGNQTGVVSPNGARSETTYVFINGIFSPFNSGSLRNAKNLDSCP